MSSELPVGVGIVGFGYWGPKLHRNFEAAETTRVAAVCDVDPERRAYAARSGVQVPIVASVEELLQLPGVDAVAIAAPVRAHHELARAALLAGRHIFVEKPFTESSEQAIELLTLARERGLRIMVDHTFLYGAPVKKLREVVASGALGDLLYYDSIRINLGLFQPDVDVIWDLAPHDFSILDHVVPLRPRAISAIGACHGPTRHSDIAYVTVDFGDQLLAHLHLNWLAPVKVRQILVGGSRKMITWDDVVADEKIKIFDRGIETKSRPGTVTVDDRDGRYQTMISYRTGDMHAPWLDRTEALFSEARAFGAACRDPAAALVNDGVAGLRIVLMLEAASQSLARRGEFVEIDWSRLRGFEEG